MVDELKLFDMAPNLGGEHTIDEMGEELAQSRAKGGGNRTVLTKLANEAHELLKDEVLNRPQLKTLTESFLEKLEIVKSLDDAILETCEVEDIELKIEESCMFSLDWWSNGAGSFLKIVFWFIL